MNTFVQAVESRQVNTDTLSLDPNLLKPIVDLFFYAGASRGRDLTNSFASAFNVSKELTARLGLWLRDARGGAGEREQFRSFLNFLEIHSAESKEVLKKLLPAIAEVGRYDDYFCFNTPEFKRIGFQCVKDALNGDKRALAAKWCPREKSAKSAIAKEFRKFLNMTPKQYRTMLSGMTNVVETQMCEKQWKEIKFSSVPSVAASRYQKAFHRNAKEEYEAYRSKVQSGDAKINASVLFPYDVLTSAKVGGILADEQWKALPNYVGDKKILPMIDVSGSMECPAGENPSVTCMDIAVSLGMYLAEKNEGAFNGLYMTFTDVPTLAKLSRAPRLIERYHEVTHHVGFSTNLDAAFDSLLSTAIAGNVAPEDMPEYLLVLSDMNFNGSQFHWNDNLLQKIESRYSQSGYKVPNLIWWNISANMSNPILPDTRNVGLVSGASPSVVRNVLAAKSVTPVDIMLDTINQERYSKYI